MAIDKTSTMVGVFISVTTIPAAGNLSLGIAFWAGSEIVGSVEQLVLNVSGMVLAGFVVLLYQRLLWTRTLVVAERLFGQREVH
jgi:hypothetical protein